jgi:flagellar biogenesis protein FliO
MRTVRSLSATPEWRRLLPRFPVRTLLVTFGFLVAGVATFALVDRFAPAPPAKPAAAKTATPKPGSGKPAEPAAAEKPRKEPIRGEAPSIGTGALLVTGSVLAGAVLLLFLLKRFLKGGRHVPAGKKVLKVTDVLALGPKRAIYLIGLERRSLVVGLSGDQLTLLSEYSDQDAEPEAAAEQALVAEARTGEHARPRIAAAPVARPETAAPRLDVVASEDLTVPPPAAEPPPAAAPAAPRAFSFAPVGRKPAATQRAQPGRVPLRFRQLLEQAAEESTG